jgi:hypothetical protein
MPFIHSDHNFMFVCRDCRVEVFQRDQGGDDEEDDGWDLQIKPDLDVPPPVGHNGHDWIFACSCPMLKDKMLHGKC